MREAPAGACQGDDRTVQVSALGRVHHHATQDANRQDPAFQIEVPMKTGASKAMQQLLHPKQWTPAKGFSNGVAAEGRQVFVAGQIGWNARQEIVADDFVAQVEQALRNIVDILAEAGARPNHLVRLTWYVTDRREYLSRAKEVGRAYQQI